MEDTIQGDDLYQHLARVGDPFCNDDKRVTRLQYMYALISETSRLEKQPLNSLVW